jgi:multidrug efflux pump subunit AcrB
MAITSPTRRLARDGGARGHQPHRALAAGHRRVYEIRSTAKESNAQIIVIFNFSKNMIEAADEIRNAISTVRYKLPVEMREPEIRRRDPARSRSWTGAVVHLAEPCRDLAAGRGRTGRQAARRRRRRGGQRHGSLQARAERAAARRSLREYGISVAEVVDAVRGQNANAPVGRVVGPLRDQSIRLVGRIESPADFGQIIVRRRGNEVVRLGQLAETIDGFADIESFSLRNAHPNVSLSVTRSREGSTVAVANGVAQAGRRDQRHAAGRHQAGHRARRRRRRAGQPEQRDRGAGAGADAHRAGRLRVPQFVALHADHGAEPADVRLAAFIAVWLCGFTLNFMTLLGISLAIGVLIDDAIVVRENIVRHMENGADRITAARTGTRRIGLAVRGHDLLDRRHLHPGRLHAGVAGEWFRPFALTVATRCW